MNDFRERLNDLARQNTSHVSLRDPSMEPVAASPRRRRQLMIAVATVVAIAATLFLWQGADNSATSVVAGQGDGEPTTEPPGATAAAAPCDLEAIVPVLRAGLPTYDYQPAGSFGALYDDAQAVVTGEVTSAARVEVNGGSYVELTLAGVTDLVTGEARLDVDIIAYQSLWADGSSPDPLAEPLVFEGVTFLGFVNPWSGVRGGWAPGPEGLYLGCGADGRYAAVIENAAGPDDVAEPTADELRVSLALDEERERLEAAQRAATENARRLEEDRVTARLDEWENVIADWEQIEQELTDFIRVEQQKLGLGVDPPTTVAEARELWDALGVEDYQLSYSEFRPQGGSTPVRVSVERGQIVDVQYQEAFGETEQAWSVDDMFDLAEAADTVQNVEFDRTYGYPTLLRIDPDGTIPGDELRLRDVEMVTATTLELADARIDAWLAAGPAPMPPPGAVAAMLRNMNEGEVPEVHLLHEEPELDAFVFRTSDYVCAMVALKTIEDPDPEYSGEFGASCNTTIGFGSGRLVSDSRRPSGVSYILVIPALDDFGTDWTASAEVGRLDITPRSALLIVDDEDIPDPGPFPITLEVAGETHTLPWN